MRQFLLLISLSFIIGCATSPRSTKTSLELQAIQAKEFETTKKIAFASVLSVFQDLGYIVGSADFDTGFITVKSPTKSGFMPFVGNVMKSSKATAFIEQLTDNHTRIRLNFVNYSETSSGYGMKSEREIPIEDPTTYENAFVKIQEAIFIRTETTQSKEHVSQKAPTAEMSVIDNKTKESNTNNDKNEIPKKDKDKSKPATDTIEETKNTKQEEKTVHLPTTESSNTDVNDKKTKEISTEHSKNETPKGKQYESPWSDIIKGN